MTLEQIIKQKIKDEGPLSIATYMELALGHSEHGYYIKRDPFGVGGDFITAPEISQIFGELVGLWIADVWMRTMGGPAALVELGPGRGTLMMDALRATQNVPEFHNHITVHMVETSPTLQQAQYHNLREMHDRVEWVDSFADIPDDMPLLVIANEFFDALPIRQHVQTKDGMKERLVGLDDNDELCFIEGNAGLSLAKGDTDIKEGTIIESCPAAKSLMVDIASQIKHRGGAALIIDYGYLGDSHTDTLQAVKNHVFHPVLKEPGDADITAHVDFTTLMDVAKGQGVNVHGLEKQGTFLGRLGAELRTNMLLQHAAPDQADELISGLRRLIDPNEMGDLFKVMALMSEPNYIPAGFHDMDDDDEDDHSDESE